MDGGPGARRLRARAGGARRRGRDQARAGHAHRPDGRRPEPQRAGAARPGADAGLPRHRAGRPPGAHRRECVDARRRARRRQPRDARRGRYLLRFGGRRRPDRGRQLPEPAGVRRGRRARRRRTGAREALCLARREGRRRVPGGHHCGGEEAGRERGRRRRPGHPARRRAQGLGHPRRRERRADPQLRRDGERQGAEAHPEARLRDALRGRARVACARAARGGHRRRRGAAHTRRDAVRVVGVGLHAQPRVALRAHLLDRHPRRRCDRRRGEHPPPPGARAGGAARAARPARGGRGGRADDPRDVHGHRGAAADGVRHRADGALHEPDPDQRLDRHADLARDRVRRHAVARGEAARWPSRRRGRPRPPRGPESASLLRARDDPVSRRPRGRPQPLEARRGDRRADPRQRRRSRRRSWSC